MPLSIRHAFSSMAMLNRCLWLDNVCPCAGLAQVLSLSFTWEAHAVCTYRFWKCNMLQTWYWISQNMLASPASSERQFHQCHPTVGETINWGTPNGRKLHPEFAAQSHSSDRFKQEDKISVPLLTFSITLDNLYSLDRCMFGLSSWLPWTQYFYLITFLCS